MALDPTSLEALEYLKRTTAPGNRIAFVSGNFNIVHPGHLRLLRFAADCADYLVVGVNSQPGVEGVVPSDLRLENVRAIGFVNYAFVLRDPPEVFIAKLRPAFVVKGKEHENQLNPEERAVAAYGGRLVFSSGEVVFSSLDLMRREFSEFSASTITKPLDFPRRHGFELAGLKTVLRSFNGLRVLVIGDLIVDEYIACDPLGMSQEDPTIVVTPVLRQQFIGGAGIVAGHARGLGADVRLLSVVGNDETARFAAEKLSSYRVDASLFADESRPTTLKQRYRAGGKTLLRVSHLKQHAITADLQRNLIEALKASIGSLDLIIFSDFNYGGLPQALVDAIVVLCEAHGVRMVADSQSSSQIGDISRFKNMLLIKPTEREARVALRDFNSGLVVITEAIRQQSRARNVIVTLGAEGLLIHARMEETNSWRTDRLPAFNIAPKDTAGAGDSFLVCASLALVVGADIWQSAYLGSLAAACQVGRVGNVPITTADLEMEIDA